MAKIASVNISENESYDFYDDKLVIGEDEIPYQYIEGYGFLLTHRKQGVDFVPVANSTSFTIFLDLGENGVYKFGDRSFGVSAFRTNKQRAIDQVYSDTVKCIDSILTPMVLKKMLTTLKEDGEVAVGKLTIQPDTLFNVTSFRTKQLPLQRYTSYKFAQGKVSLYESGKSLPFFSTYLSTINAPLLPAFLGYLLNINKG